MARESNIFKKGFNNFTIDNAEYAMSLGICCICNDGKILYMKKEMEVK